MVPSLILSDFFTTATRHLFLVAHAKLSVMHSLAVTRIGLFFPFFRVFFYDRYMNIARPLHVILVAMSQLRCHFWRSPDACRCSLSLVCWHSSCHRTAISLWLLSLSLSSKYGLSQINQSRAKTIKLQQPTLDADAVDMRLSDF